MKLTSEQLDKLYDHLDSFQENNLSEEESAWLNSTLGQYEEAEELFLQYMRLSANMQWSYGTVPGDVDYPEEKLILGEPPNPELLKTSPIKRSKKQRKKRSLISQKQKTVLWVVAPLLLLGFFWGGFHLIQGFFFNSDVATKTELLQIGKRRELTEGELKLSFPTGSQAVLTAPATFIVTGDNSVRLLTGKLVANVPTSGIGFQVDTPRGRVVDLGTTFSVHATKDLNTIVQVFRG
ncbi:hypothetical protein MNBD_PLANCTO02-1240, partial [hydrothermal vent metagenome]